MGRSEREKEGSERRRWKGDSKWKWTLYIADVSGHLGFIHCCAWAVWMYWPFWVGATWCGSLCRVALNWQAPPQFTSTVENLVVHGCMCHGLWIHQLCWGGCNMMRIAVQSGTETCHGRCLQKGEPSPNNHPLCSWSVSYVVWLVTLSDPFETSTSQPHPPVSQGGRPDAPLDAQIVRQAIC